MRQTSLVAPAIAFALFLSTAPMPQRLSCLGKLDLPSEEISLQATRRAPKCWPRQTPLASSGTGAWAVLRGYLRGI